MATVKLVSEEDAQGRVKEIYEEIRSSLGIDFVPNMYKAMAVRPAFLDANWQKVQAVMVSVDRRSAARPVIALRSVVSSGSSMSARPDRSRAPQRERPTSSTGRRRPAPGSGR